jgi:hypothetical protein
MPEAERPREISIGIPPSDSPPPAIAANVCLVNRMGLMFILDFGFLDPLALAGPPPEEGKVMLAAHVGRVVLTEDIAMKLRDQLSKLLGMS